MFYWIRLFSIISIVLSWTLIANETIITSYKQLQKITNKMKEKDTITVQIKSWNINYFIEKLKKDGFEVKKWKNWELVITKKQKKEKNINKNG